MQTSVPFCNRCLCTGHTPSQCRLQQPASQYNSNAYCPRFTYRPQFRARNSNYGPAASNNF